MRRSSRGAPVRVAAFVLAVSCSLPAAAGTFFQYSDVASIEGTTARANWQAAAGSVTQVNVEAFAANSALTGNEFAGQGITLSTAAVVSGDTDSTLAPYPGFARCFTALNAGGLVVRDSTGSSESGELTITFATPVRSVGLLIAQDPEGADTRTMRIFDNASTLIGTSGNFEDDNDNTTSGFHGWVGSGAELAKTVVIANLDPASAPVVDGVCITAIEFSAVGSSVPVPANGLGWLLLASLAVVGTALLSRRLAR